MCNSGLRVFVFVVAVSTSTVLANPRTLVTADDLTDIQSRIVSSPSFSNFVNETRNRIDTYFERMPDVPIPRDPGGGYSHEQHKKNGIAIYEAGLLSLFTGDPKYVAQTKQLLLAYASLYPTLTEHPVKRSNYPGRMFWQVLNEAWWLVYAIQGYDAIRSQLVESEREQIENGLFRPLADFLSVGSANTFNRIHNHAAWAVAGVGTTGYVLDEQKYVELAFKGTKLDGSAGFYALVDNLFSPDGYYTEGPYYQRYALMPFVVFARVVQANQPELDVFHYRDGVLVSAIYACIDLSYNNLFFPLNDAIKDKGLDTVELQYGISIAYALTEDPSLLAIAESQDGFVLTADSLKVAQAIDAGKSEPFEYIPRLYRDGPLGERGALGILRGEYGKIDQSVVVKATSHGFGHGHFDRLNWLFFDNGNEVVSDYGSARFLNIEQKEGGRYLPENETWAKQTVAHNTLVVDQTSQFDSDASLADRYFPQVAQFQFDGTVVFIRAVTDNPYRGVRMERLVALVDDIAQERHLVLDVYGVDSKSEHQFDLPIHYEGQFIATNTEPNFVETDALRPLGEANGYQHLWLRARHDLKTDESFEFTWLTENRFYSVIATTDTPSQVLFAQLGANDPNFNLRPQQTLIRRVENSKNTTFVSVLESHGEYNGAAEFTINNKPSIRDVTYFKHDGYQVVRVDSTTEETHYIAFSRKGDEALRHVVHLDETSLEWEGYAAAFDGEGNQL